MQPWTNLIVDATFGLVLAHDTRSNRRAWWGVLHENEVESDAAATSEEECHPESDNDSSSDDVNE